MTFDKIILVAATLSIVGCTKTVEEAFEKPELTPVGSNLQTGPIVEEVAYTKDNQGSQSWVGGPADYFRDNRARSIGDLVTVNIDIDDKANFNNTSKRSRESDVSGSGSFNLGVLGLTGLGEGKAGIGTDSSMAGRGTVERSEKLSVALAASVRQVLPNGLLVISGTQEVLVNNEKRVLTIAGIVDPKDISRENAIAYDRIAEARISYGGKGRSSDVQEPGWMHQALDKVAPF